MDLPIKGKISLTNLVEMVFKRHVVDMDLQIKEDILENSVSSHEFKGQIFFQ